MKQLCLFPYTFLRTSPAGLSLAPPGLEVAQGDPAENHSRAWPLLLAQGGSMPCCWHCRTSGGSHS